MQEKITKLIKKVPFPVVTSLDSQGFPTVRTMGLVKSHSTPPKTLYFSTNTSSQHVAHFRNTPQSCVYFTHIRGFNYEGLSLYGTIEILEDAPTKKSFWTPLSRIYYKSPTDPDYCILRFTAHKARYYKALKSTDIKIPQ